MSNTYAVNTTRGQEFATADDISAMGCTVWTPKALTYGKRRGAKQYVWIERPYVSKLIFAVIPAILFPDVREHKHVMGKPLHMHPRTVKGGSGQTLERFRDAVDAEYASQARVRDLQETPCPYTAGQALTILSGAFEGQEARFIGVIEDARKEYARFRVEMPMFDGTVSAEFDPDALGVAV